MEESDNGYSTSLENWSLQGLVGSSPTSSVLTILNTYVECVFKNWQHTRRWRWNSKATGGVLQSNTNRRGGVAST